MPPSRLALIWRYASKVFDFAQVLAGVRVDRPQAQIPTKILSSTLVARAVLHIDSVLDLQYKSEGDGWQKIDGWCRRMSDDARAYGFERF